MTVKYIFSKKCSCGVLLTGRNTKGLEVTQVPRGLALWVTCCSCGSTGITYDFKAEATPKAVDVAPYKLSG